jgi:hypothetical protein
MPSAAAQDVLQAILEQRAAAKRREMAAPPAGPPAALPFAQHAADPASLPFADRWHNSLANRILSAPSKLFGGLVVDPAMDLATLAGDVIHGRQPTMAADPQTGEFHTDPGLADRAMNAAGMLTLGAGAVPAETNALRMGIKAYHGSPHDFERFDSSKIGTGEGAQSFGHGMYFAEREGVAKDYRTKLSKGQARGATLALNNAGGDADMAMAAVRGEIERLKALPNAGNDPARRDSLVAMNEQKLAELQKFKDTGSMSKGHMYEVDIAADPEHFLDWDKPLSEQSPQVQEGLNQVLKPSDRMPAEWIKSSPGAEQRMSEAGIPGIRYLDQGSRNGQFWMDVANDGTISVLGPGRQSFGTFPTREEALAFSKQKNAETGTRNYVVFDDKLIAILKKYGLPISAAGLAALSQLHPQEAQAAQKQRQ